MTSSNGGSKHGAEENGQCIPWRLVHVESAALTERGVDYVAAGLSESYGEALSTFMMMLRFAAGTVAWEDVLVHIAVLYISTVRSKYAPELAFIIGRGQAEGLLATRLDDLRGALSDAPDLDAAAHVAAAGWPTLGLNRGHRQWRRAAAEVTRLMTVSGHALDAVTRQVEITRIESFTDVDSGDHAALQVMNLHQTKGRESDAIVAVFRPDDYYGSESEPFENASRLLYVVLTRARQRVTLLLPSGPHQLVAPFTALQESYRAGPAAGRRRGRAGYTSGDGFNASVDPSGARTQPCTCRSARRHARTSSG